MNFSVLFLGSNFPFAEVYQAFKNTEKFIQVDIDPYKLGKRHALDASILGDAGQAAKAILDEVTWNTLTLKITQQVFTSKATDNAHSNGDLIKLIEKLFCSSTYAYSSN